MKKLLVKSKIKRKSTVLEPEIPKKSFFATRELIIIGIVLLCILCIVALMFSSANQIQYGLKLFFAPTPTITKAVSSPQVTGQATPMPTAESSTNEVVINTASTSNVQWKHTTIEELALDVSYPTNFEVIKDTYDAGDNSGEKPATRYQFRSLNNAVSVDIIARVGIATDLETNVMKYGSETVTPITIQVLGKSRKSGFVYMNDGVLCDEASKKSYYKSMAHYWEIDNSFEVSYTELTNTSECTVAGSYAPLEEDKQAAKKIIESIKKLAL